MNCASRNQILELQLLLQESEDLIKEIYSREKNHLKDYPDNEFMHELENELFFLESAKSNLDLASAMVKRAISIRGIRKFSMRHNDDSKPYPEK